MEKEKKFGNQALDVEVDTYGTIFSLPLAVTVRSTFLSSDIAFCKCDEVANTSRWPNKVHVYGQENDKKQIYQYAQSDLFCALGVLSG